MSKQKFAYVVHWTRCEYGGLSRASHDSFHLTTAEAETYKEQQEGDFMTAQERFVADGYKYIGSEPTLQAVSDADYNKACIASQSLKNQK